MKINDLIICILVSSVMLLLAIIIIGDYKIALELNRPLDKDVIVLMKMSVTGLIGIIAGYLGANKQ